MYINLYVSICISSTCIFTCISIWINQYFCHQCVFHQHDAKYRNYAVTGRRLGQLENKVFLQENNNKYSIRSHSPNDYVIPLCRTSSYFNSFVPSSLRLWNSLPESIKSSSSLSFIKFTLSSLSFT